METAAARSPGAVPEVEGLVERRGGTARGETEHPASSTWAWALELLEAAPRADVSSASKQRVWFALQNMSAPRQRPVWRAAVGVGVVAGMLSGTAIASAALGHWPAWAFHAYQRLTPGHDDAPNNGEHRATPPSRARRVAKGSHVALEDQTGVAATIAAGAPTTGGGELDDGAAPGLAPSRPMVEEVGSGARLHDARTVRRRGVLVLPARLQSPHSTDESRRVLSAMRALRRDHDPVEARALLRRYLGAHPDGALAEESLAISIEAALAHNDPDASSLGRRYLQLYPGGPFRRLAQQAAASSRRAR